MINDGSYTQRRCTKHFKQASAGPAHHDSHHRFLAVAPGSGKEARC